MAYEEGFSLQDIADTFNERGVPTARNGNKWYPATISNVLKANQIKLRRAGVHTRRKENA